MTIIATLLATLWAHPAADPESIARALEERGARVVREDRGSGKVVVLLDCHRLAVADADMAGIATLRELEILDLSLTGLTDSGLLKLAGLNRLKQLTLFGTKITDKGMAVVSGMPAMESLFLAETAIGDATLAHLTKLSSLRFARSSSTTRGSPTRG
ncbi:MAG: hypothetical protein ACKO26_05440 [Planctomycetota bacterium]